MSQPVRSSALNFSSPWLVETPESFVILDAADAWVFLSPAAPIFIWGICTHRWLLLHSCNMCYMPCSRRNNNSPGTGVVRRRDGTDLPVADGSLGCLRLACPEIQIAPEEIIPGGVVFQPWLRQRLSCLLRVPSKEYFVR